MNKNTKRSFLLLIVLVVAIGTVVLITALAENCEAGKEPLWTIPREDSVESTDFSGDGRHIVTAGKNVTLYDREQGKIIWEDENSTESATISSDGNYILAHSYNSQVYFYSRDSAIPLWNYTTKGIIYGNRASSDISSDGEYAAVVDYWYDGNYHGDVYLFSKESPEPLWIYETGNGVYSVAISEDGEYIVAGEQSTSNLYLFSKDSSTPVWTYRTDDWVRSVDISANGEYIIAGCDNNKIYFFDKDSSTPIWSYQTRLHYCTSVSISDDGYYIVASYVKPDGGNSESDLYLFSRHSNEPEWIYVNDHTLTRDARISGDRNYIAAGSVMGGTQVDFFHIYSATPLWTFEGSDSTSLGISLPSNGGFVAAQMDNGLHLFDKNAPPHAFIDVINPSPGLDSDTILMKGSGIDYDGEIRGYHWYSDRDGNLSFDKQFETSSLSLGEHNIYLKVMDDKDVWSDEVAESLIVHQRPAAYVSSVNPNPVSFGDEITFLGYGKDDGAINRYVWRSNIDGEIYNDTSLITPPWFEGWESGEIGSNWSKDDIFGGWKIVSTEKNSGSFSLSSSPIRDSESAWIFLDITGPGNLEFSWKVSSEKDHDFFWMHTSFGSSLERSGTSEWMNSYLEVPAGEQRIFWVYYKDNQGSENDDCAYIDDIIWTPDDGALPRATLSIGKHIVSLKVQDNHNVWSGETSTQITVLKVKPLATINSISPNPAAEGTTVYFEGEGTDDGTVTRYVWRSSLDGEFFNSTTANFSTDELSVGMHNISLRVLDNYGVWSDEESETLWIIHEMPVAQIDSITPGLSFGTDTVDFRGYGSDDGTITRYVWRSSLDGELHNGTTSNFSTDELSVGIHNISFKVQNIYGVWSDEISDTLLRLEVLIVSITPNPAEKKQLIEFEGSLNGIDVDVLLSEIANFSLLEPQDIILYRWWSSIDGLLSTDSSFSSSSLSSGTHTIFFEIEIRFDLFEERYSDEISVVLEVKNPTTEEDEQWYQSSFVVGSCSLVILLVAVLFVYVVSMGREKEPEIPVLKPEMRESLKIPERSATQSLAITQLTQSDDTILHDEKRSLESPKQQPATEWGETEIKKQEEVNLNTIIISGELRDEESEEKRKQEDEVATITKTCPHCKKPMKTHWMLCPYCKNKLLDEDDQQPGEDSSEHTCTECTKSVKSHWKICPYCKAKLN